MGLISPILCADPPLRNLSFSHFWLTKITYFIVWRIPFIISWPILFLYKKTALSKHYITRKASNTLERPCFKWSLKFVLGNHTIHSQERAKLTLSSPTMRILIWPTPINMPTKLLKQPTGTWTNFGKLVWKVFLCIPQVLPKPNFLFHSKTHE